MLVLENDRILTPGFWSANPELGIVISSLSWQDAVVIKGSRFGLEVPLSNHRCFVTSVMHLERKHLAVWLDPAAEVKHTIRVVVLTRDDAGP